MRYRSGGFAVVLLLLAAAPPFDLDVDLPTGSPFDSIKIPKDTPTGGRPNDTQTGGNRPPEPQPPPGEPGKPGETRAEDPKKVPPPKPPSGLPGIGAPSTIDYQQHLGWKPEDDLVDWEDPMAPPVATGTPAEPPKDPGVWDVKNYPPAVPNNLYVYAVCRYLMVMLHKPQLSESELTEFLIEMGYPGFYAATACKNESSIARMAKTVLDAIGPMVRVPPGKPAGETAQKVYLDLISHYVYEPEFGAYILSRPTEETFPVLIDIVENGRHPFLVRNAVFILRCFNNPEVVAPLRKLLMKTKDKVVRNRALAALTRWQDQEIAEWLAKQLGGNDTFRVYAVWALGRIGAVAQIDKVCAAAKNVESDGEFLLSAVPALGRLGRIAPDDKKKRIENLLVQLEKMLPQLKDPEAWGGTGVMATRTPEPSNCRQRIIGERIRISLALMGRDSETAWMKGLGRQFSGSEKLHVTNVDFFNEVMDLLEGK